MDLSDLKQSDIGAFVANVKLPSHTTHHHFFVGAFFTLKDGRQSTVVSEHAPLRAAAQDAFGEL